MDINNYLWTTINRSMDPGVWISINYLWISITDLWISINQYIHGYPKIIDIQKLDLFMDIHKSVMDISKSFMDIHNC